MFMSSMCLLFLSYFYIFINVCLFFGARCSGTKVFKILPLDVITRLEGEKVVVTCRVLNVNKGGNNLVDMKRYPLKWLNGKHKEIRPIESSRVRTLERIDDENFTQVSLLFSHIQSSDAGFYTCQSDNEQTKFQLIVRKHIIFKDTPPIQDAVEGDKEAMIRCEAKGDSTLIIKWRKPIGALDESRQLPIGDGLNIKNVTRADAGNYTCLVMQDNNEAPTLLSRQIYFRVKYKPKFTNGTDPTVVYGLNGTDVELLCPAEGDPKPNIQWFRYNEKLNGETTNRLTVPMDNDSTGEYQCYASNEYGNATRFFILKLAKKPIKMGKSHVHVVAPKTIQINITEPLLDDDFKVTKYTVQIVEKRKIQKGKDWRIARKFLLPPDSPFVITNLTENTEYVIRLRAHNQFGEGEYSEPVYTKTPSNCGLCKVLSHLLLIISCFYVLTL